MFDATLATGRDDVVLAHLNHRLVQMCLRLLWAEVWALSGRRAIHRVSAQLLSSGTKWRDPLVIAHGRIRCWAVTIIGCMRKRLWRVV